jgi:integrase
MRTWRKEAVKSAGGVSWRLITGRADERVRVNLGRVDEAAADRALAGLQRLENEGAAPRVLALLDAEPERARLFLLEGDPAEVELLAPAPIDYGAMTVAEYFDAVYWPARIDPKSPIGVAASTAETELWCWRHSGKGQPKNGERPAREKHGILDGAIGSTRMRSLDDQAWETWQAAQDHLSPRSKAIRRNAYAALLGYARRMGHSKYKPEFYRLKGATKRTREQVDPLTFAEVDALLKVADPVRRAMWAVGAGQGLRPGELVRVEWQDVDWSARTMLVRGTKTEDSHAEIPMTPLTFRELRTYWMTQGQPASGLCFTYSRTNGKNANKPVEPQPIGNYKRALATDARLAGIERHVTPYLLRHSFATIAWSLDIPQDVARRIMRHTNGAMLDRVYTRPRPADLVARLARFDVA